MPANKERLDVLVHQRGLAPSREMARRYIMAGEVKIDGEVRTKPGMKVPVESDIEVIEQQKYVSRGGYKLETALDEFSVEVVGRICADVGASTGGFTDLLLQRGAQRVYAIDVGYGQLAMKLRQNDRVINMERTNARHLEVLDEPITLVVIDASFISLQLLLPAIKGWLTPQAEIIPLIKPQFEAGKKEVSRGRGVIKDSDVHREVLYETLSSIQEMGFAIHDLVQSDVTGPKGNIEFLAWLSVGHDDLPCPSINQLIEKLLPADDDSE
ncbi:MAG: TlyA family RNA methyltransferase [Chloroflexi bacterium]|nr:TlyA family RNA methyltransferase [Chloroflexota bacterium]